MTPDQIPDLSKLEVAPVAAATWMAQRWGFYTPPIPNDYLVTLNEYETEALYGTSEHLAGLISRDRLFAALDGGTWPDVGLAFGFQTHGRSGYWRYLLVGGTTLLSVDLRIFIDTDEHLSTGLGLISRTNHAIERYLSDDVHFTRLMSPVPPHDDVPRRVISYSNDVGFDRELISMWTRDGGAGAETASSGIFLPTPPAPRDAEPEMIFRA